MGKWKPCKRRDFIKKLKKEDLIVIKSVIKNELY